MAQPLSELEQQAHKNAEAKVIAAGHPPGSKAFWDAWNKRLPLEIAALKEASNG